MTEDLIKKLKDVKQALVSKDMTGEEWEEREDSGKTGRRNHVFKRCPRKGN